MHYFKELKVWQLSRHLVKEVDEITSLYPADEKYSLISQLRRCAVSIPANIAECAGRGTDKDFAHFLNISLGWNLSKENFGNTTNGFWLNQDVAPGVLCLTS